LSDLAAALGDMTLAGSLSYDGEGARPRVEADLSAPELDLAALEALSGSRPPPAGGGQSEGAASAPKAAREGGARWSRKAIDLSGLQALDGRLDLSLDRLKADRIVMNKVELAAILDAGLLTLERFEGRYAGGVVTAEGALDARARPNASLSFDATQLSSKPILRRFFDFDRVSGPVTLSGTLNSTGRSEAELVENLSGLGKVGGTLTFEVKEEERLGNLALTILGQKVKELQGVTASANSFFNAFAGRPAELSGSYRIDAGILTSNDLKLESDRARLEDRLRVDLPGWTLETTADLYRNEDAPGQPPYLTLEAKGPLDEPNYRVAGRAFTTPGAATSGSGQKDGGQQDGGTDSQESGASTGNPLMDQLQKVVPGLVPQSQQQEAPAPQGQQAAPSPEPEPQPEPQPEPEASPEPEAAPQETEQAAPVIPVIPEPKPAPPPQPKRQEPDPDALIKGILEKLTQ
ncbi:MAG: AsmA family protein, partial [Limibacillus sp.]